MSEKTSIEWTDSTWTPIRARRFETLPDGSSRERVGWHCEHVSPGCVHCYAEGLNRFVGTGRQFKPAHLVHVTNAGNVRGDVSVFLEEKMLRQPLLWKRGRMIFVCSMTDLFADFVSDEMIDRVFAVMALTPQHTYQVLTKRADRMRAYFANPMREALIGRQVGLLELARSGNPVAEWSGLPMPHVWLGVSAEDQQRANERVPHLLATPAAVRYVSVEPMIGPVNLTDISDGHADSSIPRENWVEGFDTDASPPAVGHNALTGERWQRFGDWRSVGSAIDWVICGGERGPRPPHPEWVRRLRDQCAAAGVPFHFKQWGHWAPSYSVSRRKPRELFVYLDGRVATREQAIAAGEDCRGMYRVGAKAAGRLLEGRTHDEFPTHQESALA